MNSSELLRLVDSLHREKDIDTESVFQGIEAALLSAARKHLGASEDLEVSINRETGVISAQDGGREIDPLGTRSNRGADRQAGDDPEDTRSRT